MYIDYSKAFDKIHHDKLMESLLKINVDGKNIRLISNLYWEQMAAIRINNENTEYTKIKRGVRQGCVLSPSLFNLCTEMIFREIEDMKGVTIGEVNINNLRYADDTVLLAESEKDLQDILEVVKEKSNLYGLTMNVKKTKAMAFSKEETPPKVNLQFDGDTIEQVDGFIYLCQRMTSDGRCEAEVKRRIEIARSTFINMRDLLTARKLDFSIRLRLVNCYIWSTLLYGAETWTLTKSLEKKISAFEMWIYRRMMRISWTRKKTNAEVLRMAGLQGIAVMGIIKGRKITYFGHIKRHNSLLKELLEGKAEGRRAVGYPRTNWEGNVETWCGRKLSWCTVWCRDRGAWRKVALNLRTGEET